MNTKVHNASPMLNKSQQALEAPQATPASLVPAAQPSTFGSVLRRYRLTLVYLLISAVTFAATAWVINFAATTSSARTIVDLVQEQSARDAVVVAGTVQEALSSPYYSGIAAPGDTGASETLGRQLSWFLDRAGIYGIGLYRPDGALLWSSEEKQRAFSAASSDLFSEAAAGAIVSGLVSAPVHARGQSDLRNMDVVETYIPFMGTDGDGTALVLGVSRDVTAQLSAQSAQSRAALVKPIMGALSGAFGLLLLFVFGSDIALWHSRESAMRQRLAIEGLDIRNRELLNASTERSRFVSMVTHELKTPLTSIIAFADIMLKNPLRRQSEKGEEYLKTIQRNGAELKRIIGDLIEVSRIQSGQISLEPSDFRVTSLMDDIRQTFQPILAAKQQRLLVNDMTGNVTAHADNGRIRQVMLNLISNASKYSPAGKTVLVTLTARDSVLAISVKDEGIGISKEDQTRLFTPFFRVDNSDTRAVQGTGLGLTIARAIVMAHHGTISVASEPGVGTEVSVRVPVLVTATPAPSKPGAEKVASDKAQTVAVSALEGVTLTREAIAA